MASPFHHHHPHHPPTTASCCCTTSYSSCHCTQSYPSPQPNPDPLLQAIASQLLISNPPDPYHQHQHQHHQAPHKTHKSHHPKSHFQTQQQLLSFVSRIEALEASLHHHSSNRSRSPASFSLRDSAARVIQTHFRAFLVRRSRTLRQLKDLAFIKSSFASLKSSISNQTHFGFHSVSQKALALLIKLDSIECGDPIVRDGKRSISRDIVKFLEFIEGVVVKRQVIGLKSVKNVRCGQSVNKSRSVGKKCGGLRRDEREMIGKLKERIEKIRGFARVSENDEEDVELEGFQHVSDDEEEDEGSVGQYQNGVVVKRQGFQPKVKKSVRFAEDQNVFSIFSNGDEAVSSGDGSDSSEDQGEPVEDCGEVDEVKGFAQETEDVDESQLGNGGSLQTSDPERNARALVTQRGHGYGHDEHLLFSPPLPVKMDSKDVVKRNRGVKIVT